MQLQGRENGTCIESKISFKNFLSVNVKEKKYSVAFTVLAEFMTSKGKAWLILLGRLLFIKNPTEQIYIWLKKPNCIKMYVEII